MKKLSILFLLLTAFIFVGCSDDDDDKGNGIEKETVITSFEGKLTGANSEFIAKENFPENESFSTTFQDNNKTITFPHSYANWGYGYTFSQFTYTNRTDNSAANSTAAITKKGKVGTTYLSVYAPVDEYTPPAEFTINNPQLYKIKGAWVTNSTYAYNGMTVGDGYAEPFKKGSWYKLKATGYTANGTEINSIEIELANYKSDDDKPVNEWIWFDMTELDNAVKIKFTLTSTDNDPQWGMRTAAYFCMDGITLEEK